jgi:hypothetical protein
MFAQTWIGALNIVTTDTTATITWGTAVPADTQVKYGVSPSYGSRSTLNSALITIHSATLTKLQANTQYHVRALAHDSAGILVTGPDYVFATQAGAIAVTVTPTSATVNSGGTQQFSAQVVNTGNTSVTWTATAGSISSSGLFTAPTITADQSVTVTAKSVADPTKAASASVTVKAPVPALGVSPKSVNFSATQGGSNPSQVPVSITNTGGGTLSFTVASDAAWLIAGPASGTAPATVQLGANIAGLAAGTYTGHITVSAAGASNSPATITVTLTVTAAIPISHSVDLSWNASTSSDVVSYSAYRSSVVGGPYGLVASAITGTKYTDLTVQSGVTYFYVVTAMNSGGPESVNSNEAKAIVP